MKVEIEPEEEDRVVRERLRAQIAFLSLLPDSEREENYPDWERLLNGCKAALELFV